MVYGIGYNSLPRGIATTQYMREYYVWKAMLYRCTEKFQEKYPTYKGVSVDDRWKDFANFLEDIKELEGYDFWKDNPNQMVMLDKDTKAPGNKLYSKDTCCFLSHADSNRDVSKRHPEKIIKAYKQHVENSGQKIVSINKKTKEVKIFNSIRECSRLLNINNRHVWMCLSKEDKYISHKSSHGYVFIYYDEFDEALVDEYINQSKYNTANINKKNECVDVDKKDNVNKIIYTCQICGKSVSNKSNICRACYNKQQRKVKDRPSKEELLELIKTKSFLEIGRIYNISDNAVRKWCKSYGLPYRKKDIQEL